MSGFINTANGHREDVSSLTWLWALLFGLFFFMYKGIWRHVLIQLVLIVGLYAAFGAPATMFVFVMWVTYAFCAHGIVEASYLRQGYASASDASTPFNPNGLSHVAPRSSPVPTDAAYEAAMNEWDSKERHAGLWARVFAESSGNEASAKAAYIKERAHAMAAAGAVPSAVLGASSPAPQRPPV